MPGPNTNTPGTTLAFGTSTRSRAKLGARFSSERKFHGEVARARVAGSELWLLKPNTYVNRSGQAVVALALYYKILPTQILVAHDELDLPPGAIKLKLGGGTAGHNGLKDTQARLSTRGILAPAHRHRPSAHIATRARRRRLRPASSTQGRTARDRPSTRARRRDSRPIGGRQVRGGDVEAAHALICCRAFKTQSHDFLAFFLFAGVLEA